MLQVYDRIIPSRICCSAGLSGLGVDDPTWVPTVFSKNRGRLLTAEVARTFLAAILAHRKVARLLSDALLGRWHADQGMGLGEELSAEVAGCIFR